LDLFKLTIHELHEMLVKKEISSLELTKSVIKRIEETDPKIKAYVTVVKEQALVKAQEADDLLSRGENVGLLTGIPMALKDNICTEGILTTCSSQMLKNFVPPYDATVTRLLSDAGAVLLGKLNMDEFAMGSSTENSAFFHTRNPWNTDCVPGGSSGGVVAAVAADEAVFALGSDTGGSIRQPASFCGVIGLKPTYGYVSRYGLVAFTSSLDQVGPVTKDVTDCAIVLNAIAGHDPKDSTSADVSVPDFTKYLTGDIAGMKIGIPKEYFAEGIQPEVKDAVMAAVQQFADLGAWVEEVSLPHTEYALPVFHIIASAECSSNLARYDGVCYGYRAKDSEDIDTMFKKTRREGFGPEVKRRIILGTYALSSGYYDAYYLKALKVRTLIKEDFDRAFAKYDILISPASPNTAFKFGEKLSDPLAMHMSDRMTIPTNLAGIPGISVPCGFAHGLPIGLHIMGKAFDEGNILKAAYAYEQAAGFYRQRPNRTGEE
jgi:aspartyl-tRNA(Asn)/glutamyl-tRNA(Gln) amidotransferase subunit A